MRLRKVETGHRLPQKLMMRMIRLISRDPGQPQDGVKTVFYRPKFFGKPFTDLMHQTMHGHSCWTRGERELFASFTSLLNECRY